MAGLHPLIESLRFSFLVHATEDRDRIIDAVTKLFAVTSEDLVFQIDEAEGYYGNPVMRIIATVGDSLKASAIAESTIKSLPPEDREGYIAEIPRSVDEGGKLYLRLDKQAVCMGRLRRGKSDPILVILKPSNLDRKPKRTTEELWRSFLSKVG